PRRDSWSRQINNAIICESLRAFASGARWALRSRGIRENLRLSALICDRGFVERNFPRRNPNICDIVWRLERQSVGRKLRRAVARRHLTDQARDERLRQTETADLRFLHLELGDSWTNDVQRSAQLHALAIAEQC